jgi:NAD(P)-dependent dehydrogenase (short-subunit alcohol dehydrogenase family)
MEIKNASIVITGGAQGLGAALALKLQSLGAKVLVADISEEQLHALHQETGVATFVCNITDRASVTALKAKALEIHGQIDIWINNAGIWMPYMPAEEIDFIEAHRLMEVNYFGLAYGTLEALEAMRPNKTGLICNVISIRALKGKALGAAYSASKFAAEGFTQAVRDEVREEGIKVVAVHPYRIKTNLFGENKHADYEASMDPHDVAAIIVENLYRDTPDEHIEIWQPDDVRTRSIVE